MQQIADWLEKLGMSEYAERFAESDIDTSVLRDLTDQDLKELGVSLGHRRKMLRAIAELAGVAPTSPQPVLTEPKGQDTAERRQVTVMFSDLVGSTALSARMDPEDLRDVISAYQKCVAGTVCRFDGFVAKYMGDWVLSRDRGHRRHLHHSIHTIPPQRLAVADTAAPTGRALCCDLARLESGSLASLFAASAPRALPGAHTLRRLRALFLLVSDRNSAVVILKPELMDRQHLYVAMTRGARTLVICSGAATLTPE